MKKRKIIKESRSIKIALVLQSFAPLFLLLTIKFFDGCVFVTLVCKAVAEWNQGWWDVVCKAVCHPSFGAFLVSALGIIWIIMTVVCVFRLKKLFTDGFQSHGETVQQPALQSERSLEFLMSYVLPLLTDDINTIGSWISFLLMLVLIIALLIKSRLFYLNPILTLLNYKVYSFTFKNPYGDIQDPAGEYIGISLKEDLHEGDMIRRKHIADNVYLIRKA